MKRWISLAAVLFESGLGGFIEHPGKKLDISAFRRGGFGNREFEVPGDRQQRSRNMMQPTRCTKHGAAAQRRPQVVANPC